MLNRSASLAMSTCVLKALPGKLDIKRHSPSILYFPYKPRLEIRAETDQMPQNTGSDQVLLSLNTEHTSTCFVSVLMNILLS